MTGGGHGLWAAVSGQQLLHRVKVALSLEQQKQKNV
jgi:hypothetical protein